MGSRRGAGTQIQRGAHFPQGCGCLRLGGARPHVGVPLLFCLRQLECQSGKLRVYACALTCAVCGFVT